MSLADACMVAVMLQRAGYDVISINHERFTEGRYSVAVLDKLTNKTTVESIEQGLRMAQQGGYAAGPCVGPAR